MLCVNFNAYASYVTDSLYQWDVNQDLVINGLGLSVAPEIHFANADMDRAIVRQSTLESGVVTVRIPNSILQSALTIKAYVGIYEGETFKVIETIEIPVIAKTKPADYVIEDSDEEVYSFKALENMIANIVGDGTPTEGNKELIDVRLDIKNAVHASAGQAVRFQINELSEDLTEQKSEINNLKEQFNKPIQEQVDNWLDAHPETTTTVQDGSLTEEKFSDELKVHTIKDYVTPQMFGAVGDGVADDTIALKSAFEYAAENNIRCFIPSGIYNISPTLSTKYTDGWTYTYCFDTPSNLHIEGASRESVVLKVVTDVEYTSVFCNYDVSTAYSNISIKNLTIEQNYDTPSSDIATSGRNNPKYVIGLYSPCENVVIDNIYFKNCCGVNTVHINHYETTNVTLSNCKFDYKYVREVDHYDRSVVYMECANYLVINNEVNGNFETLGGIELHGYNGTCRNNRVRDCYTAIHIAPRFYSPIETASIWVSENYVKDSCFGIKLWKNTSSKATKGFEGVYISGNKIEVDCSIAEKEFFHYAGMIAPEIIGGIVAESYMDTTYRDVKIIDNSIVYHNALNYTTVQAPGSFAIGLYCPSDLDGVFINHNYIEGAFGSGICLGSDVSTIKTMKNVEIIGNIIKNCGRSSTTDAVFQSYILLRHGNKERIFIKNNILEKTDIENKVYCSFYNLSTNASTHKDVYFTKDNVIMTASGTDMVVTNYAIANIIYDEGATALRPTIAKKGHKFYDTTLGKMFLYTGSAWTPIKTGEEGAYELLETITTTEDQGTISSTFDACFDVLCKVTVPPSSLATANVGIETNLGYISGLPKGIRHEGLTSYWTVRIFPRNGYYYAETSGAADYNTLIGTVGGMAMLKVNTYPTSNNITTVVLKSMSTDIPFPTGTIVEVWGVKK